MTPPNILYIGCVPVERSYYGSLLLYRLFQTVAPERLRIVEGYLGPSRPDRQLAGVAYASLLKRMPRLRTTRFAGLFDAALDRVAGIDAWRIRAKLGPFRPDAVVTVAHGYAWRTAASYAARHALPLHIIVHDDWPTRGARDFARVYRAAASRLCVSPGMEETYAARYGVPGTLLYPSRAPGVSAPLPPQPAPARPFTIAYAGTISGRGYFAALSTLSKALEPVGGRLLIHGPLTVAEAARIGLAQGNVTVGGLVDPEALPHRLVEKTDALFLPMSFADEDRANMRLGFPSKLADYTLLRMPILLFGPPDCSAAVWARSNPGALLAVTTEDTAALSSAVARLAGDAALRASLGQAAGEAGDRDFSHEAAFDAFQAALGARTREAAGQSVAAGAGEVKA